MSGQYLQPVSWSANDLASCHPHPTLCHCGTTIRGLSNDKGHGARRTCPSLVEGAEPASKEDPKGGREQGGGLLGAAPASHMNPGPVENTVPHQQWDHMGTQPVLCTLSGGWVGGLQAGHPHRALPQGLLRSF